MRILITNTLKKREYLYYKGNIIYLDQIKEILEHIIKSGHYLGYTVYKNRLFLYEQKVISKDSLLDKPDTLYGDSIQAEQLYNKYFGKHSYHIKNPIMKIHDAAINLLTNILFPGFILQTVVEKGIKMLTHKDL